MRRGHWDGTEWKGHSTHWEMQPGAQAWRGFGRKILFGLVFFFALMAFFIWAAVTVISAIFPSLWTGLLLMPVIVVVVVGLSIRSGLRTWRPVRRLIDAAGRLADGDYSARVAPSGSSASRRVVDSFNEMARRLEDSDEQRRQLLADLGHELRTPLTVVRGEIEAIVDGVHEPDAAHFEMLLDEVAVMERLLEDLRTLSLAEAGALALHREPTDLVVLVSDTVEGHRRTANHQAVVVVIDGSARVGEVMVDPVRIREVVSNLVVNALRAMPDGGALNVRVAVESSDVVIEVKDTGVGIEPREIDEVFERFRKGSTSAGSGLGLTISRDLVEAHGGSISIESLVAAGTAVVVRLPAVRV
ncbi:MAG: HAMP domain-containing protein [bacterium]|nr:HAMP domain-containing protein [bacterium]